MKGNAGHARLEVFEGYQVVGVGAASFSSRNACRAWPAWAAVAKPRLVTCFHFPVTGSLWLAASKYQPTLASRYTPRTLDIVRPLRRPIFSRQPDKQKSHLKR